MAALATLVIGFLWYSLLFARPWMVLMGYDPDDKAKLGEDAEGCGPDVSPITGGRRALGGRAGKIIAIATVDTALYGMKIGLAVWLGFVTTINTGYQLVCYRVMGAILGAWR